MPADTLLTHFPSTCCSCCCCCQVEGVQPTTTPDDNVLAEHIIMADPRIRQLLRERYDISDPDLIVFDPWTLHGTPEGYEGRRLMQVRVNLCE